MNTLTTLAKKTLLIAGILFIMTGSLFAQQRQGPPPVPTESQITEMVNNLSIVLSLSKGQETDIHDLFTEHFEEVKELTGNSSRPSREKMDSLREKFEKEIKSNLSNKQQKQFEKFMQNIHKQNGQRPDNQRKK